MSQRMMPPKMLISTAFTLLSESRMRNAFLTCSADAPPPTSRKFAGLPPASLMMSIVRHRQTGAVDHARDVAVELDVVEPELAGFDFERLFFVEIAKLFDVLVAIERVVVEIHLRVERVDLVVAGYEERIDFGKRRIRVLECLVQARP